MKEIKFRAWVECKMFSWDEMFKEIHFKDFFLLKHMTNPPKPVAILMQYTGLKDKNGKEIYEGDILRIEGATANVVFWERPPEFGLDYYHNESEWCEDWNITDDCERMEIIGNIYEPIKL